MNVDVRKDHTGRHTLGQKFTRYTYHKHRAIAACCR
jgi:hypothetical protein